MAKKFSLFIAALAVLAFAVPAMASASTGLTMPEGTLVPTGTAIQGVSTNAIVKNTKFGTLSCAEVKLLGKVTLNNAAEGVKGEGTGEQTGTSCKVGSSTATVKEIKLSSIQSLVGESGTGKASFTFTAVLPGSLVCKFTGTEASGSYTSGTNVITITEAPLSVSPASCVSTTPKLSGEFKLETNGGGATNLM